MMYPLRDAADLTAINAGYATLSEEDLEGLGFLQGGVAKTFRNHFDRFRYQMYQYIVIENGMLENMSGKAVLETGCGRGGGLNYIAQNLHPRYAIGVDGSKAMIDYCKTHWPKGSHVQCDFLSADVEHLSASIPRLSIDYVIDIESFFYYQDKQAYLREVHSVLAEDGKLFMSFFLQRTKLEEVHHWMRQYFDIVKEEDITDNVLHSLRLDTNKMSRFADQHYPMSKSSTMS